MSARPVWRDDIERQIEFARQLKEADGAVAQMSALQSTPQARDAALDTLCEAGKELIRCGHKLVGWAILARSIRLDERREIERTLSTLRALQARDLGADTHYARATLGRAQTALETLCDCLRREHFESPYVCERVDDEPELGAVVVERDPEFLEHMRESQ